MKANRLNMPVRRVLRDYRELRRALAELRSVDSEAEQAARYQLVASTRRFARVVKASVDDKLSFSATLMRAGEVDAANRLLAEVERDVRNEEAVLLEQVNETKAAKAVRRERLTRLRLARTLAAATLSVTVLASGALAMSVAGVIADSFGGDEAVVAAAGAKRDARGDGATIETAQKRKSHRVKILGKEMNLKLSAEEFDAVLALAGTDLDASGLALLLEALPASQVEKVSQVIDEAAATAAEVEEAVQVLPEPKKKKKKDRKERRPEPEPSPSPSPDDNDSGSDGGGEGEGDGSNGSSNDDGLPGLP